MKSVAKVMITVLGVALCAGNVPVIGEPVFVEFAGEVDSFEVSDGLTFDGSIEVGSPMTGFFSYDANAKRIHGKYPLSELSMTIGNYTFSEGSMPAEFQIDYSPLGTLIYFIDTNFPQYTGVVYINKMPRSLDDPDWTAHSMGLHLMSHDALGISHELPTWDLFPDLSVFERERTFHIEIDPSDLWPGFRVTGEITSITAIPEPATFVLLTLGVISLTRKRK